MDTKNTLQVSPLVHWLGVHDKDIVTFDIVMETKYGTTYNSYFINAQKKTVVECVKEKFAGEWLAAIQKFCNLSEIEYIILDHTEPDHSGSLKYLLKEAPNAIVVGSGNALRYIQDMMDLPFKSLQVKDNDTLNLGNCTMRFISAPNLHWPDSMYTYLEEDQILFTCDSFGAHYSHDKMFDDEVPAWDDSFKYYFDVILKPYSKFMLRAIEKIRPLTISTICPGHGPILRKDWKKWVDLSEEYARMHLAKTCHGKHRVFISYISAYGYTKDMASALAKGIAQAGDFEINLVDIERSDLGEIDSHLENSSAFLIGSPTINQNILLPVYRLFALINPIRDRGKLAASFGSYGWSGEGVKIIDATLKQLKLTMPFEGLSSKFRLNSEKEQAYIEFGKQFGEVLLKTPQAVSE